MSVKVVQGLIGGANTRLSTQTSANQQNQATSSLKGSASAVLSSTVAQNMVTTEAVNVSIRTQRAALGSEKIRDYKEAKEVADKTADEIRKQDKEEASGTHSGLNSTAGGAHLV